MPHDDGVKRLGTPYSGGLDLNISDLLAAASNTNYKTNSIIIAFNNHKNYNFYHVDTIIMAIMIFVCEVVSRTNVFMHTLWRVKSSQNSCGVLKSQKIRLPTNPPTPGGH